jgi:hypothetical protein
MTAVDNATARSAITQGAVFGALGVLAFSLSLPATRAAVEDLDTTVVGLGRALIAGALASRCPSGATCAVCC